MQISIIIAPLRNRVILFHLFFPTVPVGQGSGRFPPSRGIGPPHQRCMSKKPTTRSTTRRLFGRLPCGLARARPLLSEPSEWEVSSSDRQFTIYQHHPCTAFSIACPGKSLPCSRLLAGSVFLDSRPRQGPQAVKSRLLWLEPTFAWPDAVMTACCACCLFQDFGLASMLSCSRCYYSISIYLRRCLGRRSLSRAVSSCALL